jgi:ribosomal protein L37AE/L43A
VLEKSSVRRGVDLDRCTRCGELWGFEIVERVEIWKCSHCGYEARERSLDLPRMLDAEQESMVG